MAWYNEKSEAGSKEQSDEGRLEDVEPSKRGGESFGPGAVPPWVQAASLPEENDQVESSPAAGDPAQTSPVLKPPSPAPAPAVSASPPADPAPTSAVSVVPQPLVPAAPQPSPARRPPLVVSHGQPVPMTAPPDASVAQPVTATATAVNPATVAPPPPPPPPPPLPVRTEGDHLSPHPTTALEPGGEEEPVVDAEAAGGSSALDIRPGATQGPLSFQASAWEYVRVSLLSFLLFFIPIFGWAGQWLVMNRFIIEHLRVEGRPLKYTMTYGYALKTIFGNLLMLVITLGLGLFWLHVKQITAIYAHAQYADEVES